MTSDGYVDGYLLEAGILNNLGVFFTPEETVEAIFKHLNNMFNGSESIHYTIRPCPIKVL